MQIPEVINEVINKERGFSIFFLKIVCLFCYGRFSNQIIIVVTYFFFPAAGLRSITGAAGVRSNVGYYWSLSTSDPNYSWYLCFTNSMAYTRIAERALGLSVRCVARKLEITIASAVLC